MIADTNSQAITADHHEQDRESFARHGLAVRGIEPGENIAAPNVHDADQGSATSQTTIDAVTWTIGR